MKPEVEEKEIIPTGIEQEHLVIEISELLQNEELTKSLSQTEGRICRVCHSSLGADGIELGCLCKNELGAAHRQCAETWFTIKGSKTCEICGQAAKNIRAVDHQRRAGQLVMNVELNVEMPSQDENGNKCRAFLCNLLLAVCVVIPFLPWLFRVHVLKL